MQQGNSTKATKSKMQRPQNLCVRIVLLSLFVLTVNLWANNHFGQERLRLWLANGPWLLIAIVGSFSKVLKKEDTAEFGERMKRSLLFSLQTPVLVILYGLFLAIGSLLSSVTVMSGGVDEKMSVKLRTEGAHQHPVTRTLNGADDELRIFRFVTPFGRPVSLDVQGYQRYSFDLYPGVGKRVRVSSDLQVSPSVLIRTPFSVRPHLEKGRIEVRRRQKLIADVPTSNDRSSVIIGRDQPIPSDFVPRWTMELLAQGDQKRPIYACLLAWRKPQLVAENEALVPGMELEAKFYIEKDKPIASAKFRVGTEKIQDVLLLEEKEP